MERSSSPKFTCAGLSVCGGGLLLHFFSCEKYGSLRLVYIYWQAETVLNSGILTLTFTLSLTSLLLLFC